MPQTDLAITKTGPAVASLGATLVYTLNVSNNGPLTIGAFTATYTNPAAINIPDSSTQMVTSTIEVAGLPQVQVARASLRSLTHTWPEDIDTLLVAPGGQKTFLISDPRGGDNPASNIDLQFDDAAAAVLCTSGVLASGTYHPTDCPNDVGNDTFPAPAPAGPYTATLSVFNLAEPNGTWKLFARDDTSIDTGSIGDGWTLTLVGTYDLTVTDTLPVGTTFVGAAGDGWSCGHVSGVVTCTRADLAPGAAPHIVITATAPIAIGSITNTALVGSQMPDSAPANNTAQFTTSITADYNVMLPIVLR
jgi:subtilisin-like proprotein convertase family protein